MGILTLERFPEHSWPPWARVGLLSIEPDVSLMKQRSRVCQSANKHLLTSAYSRWQPCLCPLG